MNQQGLPLIALPMIFVLTGGFLRAESQSQSDQLETSKKSDVKQSAVRTSRKKKIQKKAKKKKENVIRISNDDIPEWHRYYLGAPSEPTIPTRPFAPTAATPGSMSHSGP